MTSKIIAGLALVLSTTAVFAQQGGDVKESHVHIGLVYPLSTNGVQAFNYKNQVSLHAIGGASASEEGFCASGVGNVIRYNGNGFIAAGLGNIIMDNAEGVQAAGFLNYVKNNTHGFQAAGFANITGSFEGVQAGGFANINTKATRGAQLGGFLNMAKEMDGLQAAGFANLTMKNTEGTQLGGFMNITKDLDGFQAAGFTNLAKNAIGAQVAGFGNNAKDIKGAQVAGFYNIAKDVNTQVAGFINIAKNVNGAQVGFINIADSSDYPVGIINISKKGEKMIGATVDDNLTTLVTFRSGGKYLYGIVGVGANFRYPTAVYASEAGIGAHIPLAKSFRINLEAVSTSLSDYWTTVQINSTFRVLGAVKLGQKVELFAGPAFHYTFSNDLMFADSRTNYLWSHNQKGYYQNIFIGGIAGLHFNI